MSADIILRSGLPATSKLHCLALFDLAHPDNGHVAVGWDELSALWDCAHGSVRRHLGAMHQAGVIHYSSNGDGIVYITFRHIALARAHARKDAKNSTESARGRAESDHPRAADPATDDGHDDGARAHDRKDAKNSTENARGRAESDRPRAFPSYADADAGLVGWLGSTTTTDPEPTNQPADPQLQPQPLTDEQALAFALLMEVRMRADKAAQIAASVPFEQIRDAIGAWWCGRKSAGGVYQNSPGIVVAALVDRTTVLPPAPAPWQRDELFLRYRTRSERDAAAAQEIAAQQMPDEPDDHRALLPPLPEPGSPAAIWSQLKSDFALSHPDRLIADSWFVADLGESFVIGVADGARLDWADKKLRPQIKRKLAVLTGRTVDVVFQVMDKEAQ